MRPSPLLYEINTRCWLHDLSRACGQRLSLADVPETELETWERLGFSHIWLMGVWTTGPLALARARSNMSRARRRSGTPVPWIERDVGASPFAIAEYEVCPALGGGAALADLRRRMKARGLKLILDFVPNHVGLDHPWVSERPGLLVQSPKPVEGTFAAVTRFGRRWLAHGRDPYFPPWIDTVQVDYRRAETWEAMANALLKVAGQCDGLRCDMAMLLLREVFAKTWAKYPSAETLPDGEFWSRAIAEVRGRYPDFLLLAEAYWGLESRLLELGFDHAYDKTFYDKLMERDAAGAQAHLLGQSPRLVTGGARFLENHDEARVASRLGLAEHRAAAFLVLGVPGMRLLHEGQLSGARERIPVQLLARPLEPEQVEIREMYEALFGVLKRSGVGQGGGEMLVPRAAWAGNPTGKNMFLVKWQSVEDVFDLVVVNLAAHPSQCRAPLDVSGLERSGWSAVDLVGGGGWSYAGQELAAQGVYLDLPANGIQLLRFERTGLG